MAVRDVIVSPGAIVRPDPGLTSKTDRPRRPQTVVAYDELKRRILQNEMPAGFQAMETELGELLAMSRTPVREALIRLANEGLVEVRPRHGMRVLPVSVDDMREIYQILTALESSAAGLAARRGLDASQCAQMEQAVADMGRALEHDDRPAWADADQRFHQLLVACCGNERLRAQVETYMDQTHRVRMLTLKLREKPTQSTRDHAALVAAIKDRDADRARTIHHQHRESAGDMLVSLLKDYGVTQF